MTIKPARRCCDTPADTSHLIVCPNSRMNTGRLNLHVNETPADLKEMNILPAATRIGWETRQQHTDRLINAYGEGFLTEAEYNARMLWLETAQTETQAKLVFKDLPSLRVTKLELAPHLRKPATPHAVYLLFAGFAASFGLSIVMALQGNSLTVLFALLTVALWINIIRILKKDW